MVQDSMSERKRNKQKNPSEAPPKTAVNEQRNANGLSITRQILLTILDATDDALYMMTRGYGSTRYSLSVGDLREQDAMQEMWDRIGEERELKKQLKRLQKQKLVKIHQKGEQIMTALTQKGAIVGLRAKIKTTQNKLPEGEVCLVVFDVPEDIRHVRLAIRRLLKKIGFIMEQKSVWRGELEIIQDLQDLVRLLHAEEYVHVYRALDARYT